MQRFFKVNTASNKYHMLHLVNKNLTCFEFNITSDLLRVNFSYFINRRSELNKTLQTLSEVIIAHSVHCL